MKRTLYVGLELPERLQGQNIDHCPLIEVHPRPIDDSDVARVCRKLITYTHVIFTSKTAVEILCAHANAYGCSLDHLQGFAVGVSTAAALAARSRMKVSVAENETAEGVVELLEKHDFFCAHFLWPHSHLSRPLLSDYLASRKISCDACVFYETHTRRPASLPDLSLYDEIVFTSPSTVDAFVALYGALPADKILTPIGPVTAKRLF